MRVTNLGVALRAHRGDMSQRLAAASAALTVNYLSLLENDKRVPSLDVLAALAATYGVRVSEIIRFAEEYQKGCV